MTPVYALKVLSCLIFHAYRKRKGGIKLDEAASEEKGVEDAEGEKNDFAERIAEEVKAEKEAQERNRADNLWSSFLSDVGQKSKSSTSARLQSSSKEPPPASLIKVKHLSSYLK